MQIWASAFPSEVLLLSSSVVHSQSFLCASGQRLRFQYKTGDLTKHRCDEINEESSQVSVAAWHFTSPSSLFIPFLPFSRFHSWNLRKLVKPIHSVRLLLHHSFNFVHIWAFLNFTVLQQHKSCKHKPGAGLVSRVSVTERSYLSSTAIMSFSPCFKKRKDSCSLCHLTISVLWREWWRSKSESRKPPHLQTVPVLSDPNSGQKHSGRVRVDGAERGSSGKVVKVQYEPKHKTNDYRSIRSW